jgi:hypothetical protein
MRLEKRIRALESKMLAVPVTLNFADGSKGEIHGPRNFLLNLFVRACGGADITPAQAEQLGLVRRSTAAEEPSGGRMTELIRCFLQGPVGEPSSVTPVRS